MSAETAKVTEGNRWPLWQRILRAYFAWTNRLLARHRPNDDVFTLLRVPRLKQAGITPPAEAQKFRTIGRLPLDASRAQIVNGIEGMRRIIPGEQVVLPASGVYVFVCCDCGSAHKFTYQPCLSDSNELVLSVLTDVDRDLSTEIRRAFEFPFQNFPTSIGYGEKRKCQQ